MKNEKKKKGLSGGEATLLAVNFVWMTALYYLCVYFIGRFGTLLPYQLCTGAYAAAAIILPVCSGVLSGNFVSKRTGEERTEEQLALSRRLMLWAIPIIAVLLIDIIDLFVVEYFKQMLSL